MKKALSVLLSVVMILSVLSAGFCVFAEDIRFNYDYPCNCGSKHIAYDPANPDTKNVCHCCAFCDNLDKRYVTSCVKDITNEEGKVIGKTFCCDKCTGVFPCSCGCECCENFEVKDDSDPFGPIFDNPTQNALIERFQEVIQKIASVFDKLFNAVYEFLRIGDLFPDLVK